MTSVTLAMVPLGMAVGDHSTLFVAGRGSVSGIFVAQLSYEEGFSLDTTFGLAGYSFDAKAYDIPSLQATANGDGLQRVYVEQDADYNVTSLTASWGGVVERYRYDPYGNVTVMNPNGTTLGDGTPASSNYNWIYLDQGMRYSVSTGTYATETRAYSPSLGRPLQEDPLGAAYPDGANDWQWEVTNPVGELDPSGLGVDPRLIQEEEQIGAKLYQAQQRQAQIAAAEEAALAKSIARLEESNALNAEARAAKELAEIEKQPPRPATLRLPVMPSDPNAPLTLDINSIPEPDYENGGNDLLPTSPTPTTPPQPAPGTGTKPGNYPTGPQQAAPDGEGKLPQHGGDAHNGAIDDYINQLEKGASNVLKNKGQVMAGGKVFSNVRPDAQWTDQGGVRHYFEASSRTSKADPGRLRANDPDAIIEVLNLDTGKTNVYNPGDTIP